MVIPCRTEKRSPSQSQRVRIELAEWSTVISPPIVIAAACKRKERGNTHNMSDVFRRIGRGGAGNFIPEKEIQDAERAKQALVSHLCAASSCAIALPVSHGPS